MSRVGLLLTGALAIACSSRAPVATQSAPARPPVDAAVTDATSPLAPPIAARIPHDVESPFGTRVDPYYWLRDDMRSAKPVLDYLRAEDTYAAAMLAPAQSTEDALAREARARVDEEQATAPELEDGYWYYARYAPGQQHPVYVRRRGTMTAPEEVVLDTNALASGHPFYALGDYAVTRDGKVIAWTDDTVGRNQFTLHLRRLDTGETLADTATDIAPSVEWAADDATLFYVGKDAATLLEDRVMRHPLGGTHELVYRESDPTFYVDIARTKSRKYIVISLDATEVSETRLLDAAKPASAPRVILPRRDGNRYELEHVGTSFVIRTNEAADNFRIVEVPEARPRDRKRWRELIPHRADAIIDGFVAYTTFVAATVRIGGLARVQVIERGRRPTSHTLPVDDPASAATVDDTANATATRVRYTYESLTSPRATYEVDIATGARSLVHQERVPTYDANAYVTTYVHATAKDGARVPISLVHRNDTALDGTAPLLVTGYGAYGESLDPTFSGPRVSLLDRGWVFAIAHVRGGAELGDAWYTAGKLLAKRNTFEDFIAVTEHLIATKHTARDRVFAEGASAGGLLVAALANLRPDLFRGLVAWVPFVDVVTTMLDPTIPLVTNEYDEWGNPAADRATYDYMLGYSPYDNIRAQAYPALYVRTGLHDSQVQYYEPAKWVAKLRSLKTDRNLLVFETDWTAGHAGKSGRFDALREQARAYAFMLYVLGGAGAN